MQVSPHKLLVLPRRLTLPSITSAFTWTLSGSVIGAGSQWVLLILLAKLGDSTMVGQFAFAWAVAYPTSLLANLNLRALFVNDWQGRYRFDRMLGARYLLVAAAGLVLLVVCSSLHLRGQQAAVLLLVGAALLIDSLSESYYSLLQKAERMDRIARSLILRSTLSLAVASVMLYATRDLVYSTFGLLFGRLTAFLAYDSAPATFSVPVEGGGFVSSLTPMEVRRHYLPRWELKSQAEMLWLAFPLGIVAVLVSINGNIPRYVIERYLGTREVGIYSALNYIPQAAVLFSTTLGSVAYARLSRFFSYREIRKFKMLLGKMVAVAIVIGLVAFLVSWMVGRQILQLLYSPEYAEKADLLPWLVGTGGIACIAVSIGYAMTAASEFRAQVPLFVFVAGITGITAFLLVPRFGLLGAAMASLVGMITQMSGAFLVLRRALARQGRPSDPADDSPDLVLLTPTSDG
jgi:O-antigen/teichoic acid export membrane protein